MLRSSGISCATIFILVRSIFRVAELWKGFESKLANEEVPFMILEGGMIVLAVGLLTFFHAGEFLGTDWKDSGWDDAKVAPEKVQSIHEMDGYSPEVLFSDSADDEFKAWRYTHMASR